MDNNEMKVKDQELAIEQGRIEKNNRLRCLELALSGKTIQKEGDVDEALKNAKKMSDFVNKGNV